MTASFATGCSTQLKVTTLPEKATVYILKPESGEKKKIGETPIDLKDKELKEMFGSFGKPGEFVSVIVEKPEFQTQNLWLPLGASGVIASEINLQLKKDDKKSEEIKTAKQILDKMFLAQNFARTKQFERALIEIDKILQNIPELARALTMKASIYYAMGDFKESLNWYEKAINVEPELTSAVDMAANVRKRLNLPAITRLPAKKDPEVK